MAKRFAKPFGEAPRRVSIANGKVGGAVASTLLGHFLRNFGERPFDGTLGRACETAFASGDYKKLAGCFGDRIHQPYRAKVLPFLDRVIEAGCAAGALGGWLSGAGSAVACATLARPDRVANAMVSACDIDAACAIVLRADNQGVRILK